MGYSAAGGQVALPVYPGVVVAQTAAVAGGTYYVSASTLLDIASGDSAYCYSTTVNIGGFHTLGGSSLGGGFQQASTTDVWNVSGGDAFQLKCYDINADSTVYTGTITAILINSPSDAKPNHSQHAGSAALAPK